ncbi:unnamed protein product [Lupinus luteus]|uniref:Uncharacterized protein n=1 Tax=Lupinus luteus TaxID=3873 RepID=A0AAV1YHL3_LUPLU
MPDDVTTSLHAHINHPDLDDEEEDFDDFSAFDHSTRHKKEDKHVVILKERNFTIIVENNCFVMLAFNPPWCSDCCNREESANSSSPKVRVMFPKVNGQSHPPEESITSSTSIGQLTSPRHGPHPPWSAILFPPYERSYIYKGGYKEEDAITYKKYMKLVELRHLVKP